ncbi:hypothetical protein HG531_013219 [Fusarium graminearum]|nr:hypothetical protein HG531_013219 [Fusarium graminearum]
MLLQLPVITTLLSLVSAQSIGGLGNVTVSFFTSDQDCESSDKKTPILTTRDIPTELICFNLTDTFSPGNKTISGYQKALEPWEHPNSNISFHLQQNDFDSSANYTQIRYELPGSEAGEKSSWVLWVYPHLNCETEVKGIDNHEYPWYEVDCQTEKGGECQEGWGVQDLGAVGCCDEDEQSNARRTDLAILLKFLDSSSDSLGEVPATEMEVYVSIELRRLNSKGAGAIVSKLPVLTIRCLCCPLGRAVILEVTDHDLAIRRQRRCIARVVLVRESRGFARPLPGGDVAWVEGAGALGGRIPRLICAFGAAYWKAHDTGRSDIEVEKIIRVKIAGD